MCPDGDSGVPVLKFPPEAADCGSNEMWKQCVSSSCAETTCTKRFVGPSCTYDCIYGCYCADGFHRNAEGNCVSSDQCPPEEQNLGNKRGVVVWLRLIVRTGLQRRLAWHEGAINSSHIALFKAGCGNK
ncbi:hypothetical protein HPB51_018375 [Rhipicephalus microplus]|uniref:TIL domain-containing protein n=1 Tax=Rhipicephalus microplus TaxID=6941 RepID=A0A9J6EUM1_RHIMP|nr:hypothetical protein HPB51_018375 [Rhipicephalus microplus]